jgi:hypothetical protein
MVLIQYLALLLLLAVVLVLTMGKAAALVGQVEVASQVQEQEIRPRHLHHKEIMEAFL